MSLGEIAGEFFNFIPCLTYNKKFKARWLVINYYVKKRTGDSSTLLFNTPKMLVIHKNLFLFLLVKKVHFRNAWCSLGAMSKPDAMKSFVNGVLKLMPHLQAYLESQKKEDEMKREEQ